MTSSFASNPTVRAIARYAAHHGAITTFNSITAWLNSLRDLTSKPLAKLTVREAASILTNLSPYGHAALDPRIVDTIDTTGETILADYTAWLQDFRADIEAGYATSDISREERFLAEDDTPVFDSVDAEEIASLVDVAAQRFNYERATHMLTLMEGGDTQLDATQWKVQQQAGLDSSYDRPLEVAVDEVLILSDAYQADEQVRALIRRSIVHSLATHKRGAKEYFEAPPEC